VTELVGELDLPLADQHGLDRLDGAVAEEGSHVEPEADLGGASVVGLREGSLDNTAHLSSAHLLNGSRWTSTSATLVAVW
jgi:hypothetical protein